MDPLKKLCLPIGLQYKQNNIQNNKATQIGGNNKYIFTNIINKVKKKIIDIPLSLEPSKIDSYMIKDIYMI